MAAPQRPGAPLLWRGLGSSRARAQSALWRPEKRRSCWSFPMGQKPKGTFTRASSYLLQQLIRRSQESDADGDEEQGEGEGESEESSESEMQHLEAEFDGVLREEAVADALHQLGRSGAGTEQVYLNLTLSGCDLIDVSILCGYVHLQKLDLSINKIEDLSCVSCMPYLLELNASQNKLTTFFNFKPPKNLKKVDFSSNQISEMCDLSAYHALTKLILDNNAIEEIGGLEMCCSLTHLSLANNKITEINGLATLPIKILCLSNNQIEKLTGLEDLKALQNLDLSHNQISSLQGLENHDFLEVIHLEDNKIAELSEIYYIENLPILRILNLLRNPIQEKSEYWLFVIFTLLRLTELDLKKIKVEEKVAAVNKYDPPPEVVAARDHLTHVVNSTMHPQRIFDSTLPSLDAPYPMLVLAGPQACGKRELAHRLCRQFNTYFRYGACHTTRPPYFGEGDRVDYHFISQEVFDEMLNMGKFILTFNYGNHNYGLNRDTVEGIARDGLASCIHLEIEGVRSLKYCYFEPRYILVVPMNKEKYEGYLRRKGLFSRAEVEFAVSRVDLYVKINQKFPGYFDAVINSDDLDAAYEKLSQLIRDYLGLTEGPAKSLAPAAGAPSNKKTVSGVPAHLVPSPRRLAKLQADGQVAERLPGMQMLAQVLDSQDPDASQSQEVPQEQDAHHAEPPLHSQAGTATPQRLGSPALGIPQQAQDDVSPRPAEEDVRQPALSPKPTAPGADSKAGSPEVSAEEAEQSPTSPSQGLPQGPPAPATSLSPHPGQDEDSGEAEAAPTNPPLSEPQQGPGPTSLSPQLIPDAEPEPPPSSSLPDSVQALEGSQPAPQEEVPKAEGMRVGIPYPELPPPQNWPANTEQAPAREPPAALLPRSRLAPTRLPQPRTLAPLQSRRPTPKLLSPSREEALGTSSDQTLTPSPRPLGTQEGDSAKLPPISPPHSRLPASLSSQAAHHPEHVQEEKASEVKLPLISPPTQEQAPPHIPGATQEAEAQKVRLPRIPTPFAEPHHDSKLTQEGKDPTRGHSSSSKKETGMQASPHSPGPVQQMGARKKKLALQRDTATRPARLRRATPGSHSKATAARVPDRPHPRPAVSPREHQRRQVRTLEIPEPPRAKPSPNSPQFQEEEGEKVPHSGKEAHADRPHSDRARNAGVSQNEPALKRELSQGLHQDNTAPLSGHPPTQEGQAPPKTALQAGPASTESLQDSSAPVAHPGRKEQDHTMGRPRKGAIASEPQERESTAPAQHPDEGTQAPRDTSQARESSVQSVDALGSKQPTKEEQTQKSGGVPQDTSPAPAQSRVSAEEQGDWEGRLRARGSQNIKV
nr:leucine-rich repeat and guanylate kinase domain-containing protein isoform X5 [Oryctolagus cuniculus]